MNEEQQIDLEKTIETFNYIFDGLDELAGVHMKYTSYSKIVSEKPDFIAQELWDRCFIKDFSLLHIMGRYQDSNPTVYTEFNGYYVFYLFEKVKINSFYIVNKEDCSFVRDYSKSKSNIANSLRDFSFDLPNNTAKKMYDVALSIYGEDRVHFYHRYYPEGAFYKRSHNYHSLVIHYPEVTLRDPNDIKIKLRGLYVSITFNENGSLEWAIFLKRTIFSEIEAYTQYHHSHVESQRVTGDRLCKKFCLGDGSMAHALNLITEERSDDNLHNFFFTLDAFLEWEDHEGGPYKYIIPTFLREAEMRAMSYSELLSHVTSGRLPIEMNVDGDLHLSIDKRDIEKISGDETAYDAGEGVFHKELREYVNTNRSELSYIFFKGQKIDIEVKSDSEEIINMEAMENLPRVTGSAPNEKHISLILSRIKSIILKNKPELYDVKAYSEKYKTNEKLIGITRIQGRANDSNLRRAFPSS